MNNLEVSIPAFENGRIPDRYTGYGEDISPEIRISNIDKRGVSMVVIVDDASFPILKTFNHCIIWNVPLTEVIPENIPHGMVIKSLSNAVQGVGLGKHKYRGPKPLPWSEHEYVYTVYVVDTAFNISPKSRKKELLKAMENHIIQTGEVRAKYKHKQ